MRVVVTIALLPLLTNGVVLQDGPPFVFRSGIDLVVLNVSVTDGRHGVVSNLQATDFTVLEDGIEQDISVFWRGPAALDIAILIDASASMTRQFAAIRRAALTFVRSLGPHDRVAVVLVRWDAEVLQPLAADVAGAVRVLSEMKPHGATALYDGIAAAFAELARNPADEPSVVRRRAIVILSDGEDTASLTDFEAVFQRARASMISVYAIAAPPQPDGSHGRRKRPADTRLLRVLADLTGGVVYASPGLRDLAALYRQIANDLGSQYLIGYTSTGMQARGAWRSVLVRVRDRPDVTARTRRGYIAAPSHPSSFAWFRLALSFPCRSCAS